MKSKAFLLILLLCPCVVFAASKSVQRTDSDPLEGYNRAAYTFNDGFDNLIAKPAAQLYLDVTPKPVTDGVSNFFENLNTLTTIGNDALQTQFHQAVTDSCRFLINSTLGILGLFDVASMVGIPKNSQGFGLTLAHYGWKNSSYFVIPFIGPSTIRDGAGWIGDYYMSVYPYINDSGFVDKLAILGIIDVRANLLQLQDVIDQAALDPYVFQRNAYLQRRAYLIKQNELRDEGGDDDAHIIDDGDNDQGGAALAGDAEAHVIHI